jgi:hypothetical protein
VQFHPPCYIMTKRGRRTLVKDEPSDGRLSGKIFIKTGNVSSNTPPFSSLQTVLPMHASTSFLMKSKRKETDGISPAILSNDENRLPFVPKGPAEATPAETKSYHIEKEEKTSKSEPTLHIQRHSNALRNPLRPLHASRAMNKPDQGSGRTKKLFPLGEKINHSRSRYPSLPSHPEKSSELSLDGILSAKKKDVSFTSPLSTKCKEQSNIMETLEMSKHEHFQSIACSTDSKGVKKSALGSYTSADEMTSLNDTISVLLNQPSLDAFEQVEQNEFLFPDTDLSKETEKAIRQFKWTHLFTCNTSLKPSSLQDLFSLIQEKGKNILWKRD